MSIDRDGTEKLVREAAERHHVDPALVRAVIETESNWNPRAYSRKGAGGLMQLIPTTAQRYGAYDLFNPQQNIDAGVRHLKRLLERYNGNLDLALAAYNAGEGAVDKAQGIPPFRETRNYVQKVQNAYFRPGSGRLTDAFYQSTRDHRDVTPDGRIIFSTNKRSGEWVDGELKLAWKFASGFWALAIGDLLSLNLVLHQVPGLR